MTIERQPFFPPEQLRTAVESKLNDMRINNESADYCTFVPDGEPTLDCNLGISITLLKQFSLPIAVITNSSLIGRPDVRNDLLTADWVSFKVDSVNDAVWRKIDRPHRKLNREEIMDGIRLFSQEFNGKLVTETMLVAGVNDDISTLSEIAEYLATIKPAVSYLSIPTRPPAEKWVHAPDESSIHRAYHIFSQRLSTVEYLIGYEGNKFAYTGNIEEDILSITSVHPMREDAVKEYLHTAGGTFSTIEKMIEDERLIALNHDNNRFYIRKFS
jgi:wyosine [tRNA(Phe)-imidazoG37] synthetase (radical SAM superfamily)